MPRRKLLIISTGGTIACNSSEDGLKPGLTGEELIKYIPELGDIAIVDTLSLMNLDSTNVAPEDWVEMAKAVRLAGKDYDGIVITHGTDTLGFTAAGLSFLLMGIDIGVVLTGSQLPIEAPETDGIRNLLGACRVACDDRLKGVMVFFDGDIIAGHCAKKVRTRSFKSFESINKEAIGYIENDIVINHIPKVKSGFNFDLRVDTDVVVYRLYPGMRPEMLDGTKAKAVVIEGYGLGGITNVRRDLLSAVKRLIDNNILVVITTQCLWEGSQIDVYEVGALAMKAGALCAGNMTTEAILAKLMWIYGQTDSLEVASRMFMTDYIGEWS